MKKTPIKKDSICLPESISEIVGATKLYDSSCSERARVIMCDGEQRFFLKIAKEGELRREVLMTRFLSGYGLSPRVECYLSEEGSDFLITNALDGEDCTDKKLLKKPKALCETLAEALHMLHSLPVTFCPIRANYDSERIKHPLVLNERYSGCMPFSEDELVAALGVADLIMRGDEVIHGDACLPNYIVGDGKFKGFVDVGEGGRGDRHLDLFFAVWSLSYNLKTNAYRDFFLDAYGREHIDKDRLAAATAINSFE